MGFTVENDERVAAYSMTQLRGMVQRQSQDPCNILNKQWGGHLP